MKYDDIQKMLDDNIESIFDEEKYKKFLASMGNFRQYSFFNQYLIFIQMPSAFKVAGYNRWKELGRQVVQKGAIGILAPKYVVRYQEIKTGRFLKKDELSKKELDRAVKAGIIKKTRVKSGFLGVNVFDISQTDPIDSTQVDTGLDAYGLKGSYKEIDKLLESLRKLVSGDLVIDDERIPLGAMGVHYTESGNIYIRQLSDVQMAKTALHETAHDIAKRIQLDGKLYTGEYMGWLTDGTSMTVIDKADEEVIVESVAYVVMNQLGIDVSEYSFGYIANWAKRRTENTEGREYINSLLEGISLIANTILNQLSDDFGLTEQSESDGSDESNEEAKEEEVDVLLAAIEANAIRYKTGGAIA